jgi:hypothetical protein
MRMRAFTTVLISSVWFSAWSGVHAQTAAPGAPKPLTSQAIDPTLFRDGAVRRFSGEVAAWGYVCDEVAQLKQRFCSLRSTVKDSAGTRVARITVSTGENGRPAALLEMAQSALTEAGIAVTPRTVATPQTQAKANGKGAGKAKPATPHPDVPYKVFPAACEKGTCQLIWTLPPDHIAALNNGAGLKLRYTSPGASPSTLAAALNSGAPVTREAAIDAAGFAAAVEASVKPSQ